MFVDPDNTAMVDSGEDIIRVFEAISPDTGMILISAKPHIGNFPPLVSVDRCQYLMVGVHGLP